MRMVQTCRKQNHKWGEKVQHVLWQHPVAGLLLGCIGVPVAILGSVCLGAMLFALPVAAICGLL